MERYVRVQVRELRKAKGLTQDQLADLAKVSRATVNRLENGLPKSIDFDVLERLAKVLGVAPGLLIAETEQSAPPAKRHR